MEYAVATVDGNGQLLLPAVVQASLGIEPGTEVVIVVEGDAIHLEPKMNLGDVAVLRDAISHLQEHFRGQPSLEEDLYTMRREEEEHSRQKYGC